MAKRLFVVVMSSEFVVYAEDEADARFEAADALRNGDADPEVDSIREMAYLPGGWEMNCIPYGAEGDETIADLVAAGAAPKYAKPGEVKR